MIFWDSVSYFSIKNVLWVLVRNVSKGAYNEYPQHVLSWRTRENYPRIFIKDSTLTSLPDVTNFLKEDNLSPFFPL